VTRRREWPEDRVRLSSCWRESALLLFICA